MLSRTILFIGLHLLCLTNIAQPLMLLTANVEDIKKIARKFLSENMAASIAEFIVKVTGTGSNAPISQENDENAAKIDVVSAENKNRVSELKAETESIAPVNRYQEETTNIYFQRKDNNVPVFNKPVFQPDSISTEDNSDYRTKRYKPKEYAASQLYQTFNTEFINDVIGKLKSEDRRQGGALQYSKDVAMNYPKVDDDRSVEHVKREFVLATSGNVVLPKIRERAQVN